MKKFLFTLTTVLLFSTLQSQDIILDKNVEEQYKGKTGPNMRHYGHFYSAFGLVADFDEKAGTAIKWWRSGQYLVGYRYKLKLLSFYALGLDLSYKRTQYFFEGIEENEVNISNPLTYNTERDKHRLINNGIGLEFYHRINIGRRGNTLGKYIDTGIRGQWNFADVENIVIKVDDPNAPSQRIRIKQRGLNYINPFSYGLTARIGFNKIIIHANYRLSDYFKDRINGSIDIDIPEVPRLVAGIQFGF